MELTHLDQIQSVLLCARLMVTDSVNGQKLERG